MPSKMRILIQKKQPKKSNAIIRRPKNRCQQKNKTQTFPLPQRGKFDLKFSLLPSRQIQKHYHGKVAQNSNFLGVSWQDAGRCFYCICNCNFAPCLLCPATKRKRAKRDGNGNSAANRENLVHCSPLHGKTIIVVNAILSALPTVNAGDQATANPLASIIELRLEDGSLTSLQANDFVGLSGLQILSLTDSSLTNLPADIFE